MGHPIMLYSVRYDGELWRTGRLFDWQTGIMGHTQHPIERLFDRHTGHKAAGQTGQVGRILGAGWGEATSKQLGTISITRGKSHTLNNTPLYRMFASDTSDWQTGELSAQIEYFITSLHTSL